MVGGQGEETDGFARVSLLVLDLGLVQRAEYYTKHAFTTFAFTGQDGEVNLGSSLVRSGHRCRGCWGFVHLGILSVRLCSLSRSTSKSAVMLCVTLDILFCRHGVFILRLSLFTKQETVIMCTATATLVHDASKDFQDHHKAYLSKQKSAAEKAASSAARTAKAAVRIVVCTNRGRPLHQRHQDM